jgi:hypothetical protein
VSRATAPAPLRTTINAPNAQHLAARSLTVTLSAEGPLAGYECSLDGEPFRRCGRLLTLRGLSDGPHVFRARAIDAEGNPDPTPASYEWTTQALDSFEHDPDPEWPEITGSSPGGPLEARCVIADGEGGWYVGGSFSEVGGLPRRNLAHLTSDKAVDAAWAAGTDGTVNALALSEDASTLYLGGHFTRVNGEERGNLAALDTRSGELTPWNPRADGLVADLALVSQSLFVVGAFSHAGGEARSKAAELDLEGAATPWNPDANPGATLLALAVSARKVYVGGAELTSIGGAPRRNLAELDRTTGHASAWDPSPDGEVEAVMLAPDGATIFVGGKFKRIGRPAANHVHAAEVKLTDEGSLTSWRPAPRYRSAPYYVQQRSTLEPTVNDFSVLGLAQDGGERRWSIVVAGAYDRIKARYPRNLVCEVVKVDDPDGDGWPGDWDPQLDSNAMLDVPSATPQVFATALGGDVLAVAGNFYASGFTARRGLAFYRRRA